MRKLILLAACIVPISAYAQNPPPGHFTGQQLQAMQMDELADRKKEIEWEQHVEQEQKNQTQLLQEIADLQRQQVDLQRQQVDLQRQQMDLQRQQQVKSLPVQP